MPVVAVQVFGEKYRCINLLLVHYFIRNCDFEHEMRIRYRFTTRSLTLLLNAGLSGILFRLEGMGRLTRARVLHRGRIAFPSSYSVEYLWSEIAR
jgi:hypothetical protein